MANETGDPDKPYMGKNGPRRTPPPGHPDRHRAKKLVETTNVVEGLFGKEAADAAEEARPKHEMPTGKNKKAQAERPPRKTPRRKKIRMGAGWTRAMDKMDAEGITMAEFVATLSPEELARGQLKNEKGSFVGAPPRWVPQEFYKECIRELMRRGKTMYQENYLSAIRAMTELANDKRVPEKDRIKAAQFVIERIEGKVPERLEIGASEPWQELLVGILVDVPPNAAMREFLPPDGAPGAPEE